MSQSDSDPEDGVVEVTDSHLAPEDEFNPLAPGVPVEPELSFFEDAIENNILGHPLLEEHHVNQYLHLAHVEEPVNMPPTAREAELITNIEVGVEELKGYLAAELTGASRRSINRALEEIDGSLNELNTSHIKKISRENNAAQKKILQDGWIELKARLMLAVREQQQTFEDKIAQLEPAAVVPDPAAAGVQRAVAKMKVFNGKKEKIQNALTSLEGYVGARAEQEITKAGYAYIRSSVADIKAGIETELEEVAQDAMLEDPAAAEANATTLANATNELTRRLSEIQAKIAALNVPDTSFSAIL